MKYSIKNKEFNRKRLAIFENSQRRSRSRSTSLSGQKQNERKSKINIAKQYVINVKPHNLNHTTVDNLQSVDSSGNSFTIKNNQQEQFVFQSFAKVQTTVGNQRKNHMVNVQSLRTCEPLKINQSQVMKVSSSDKKDTQNDFSNSESFQVCEHAQNDGSRMNRFFTTQNLLTKQSLSPRNKVVFEPVVRRSVSQSPKSLSPDAYQRASPNTKTPANLQPSDVSPRNRSLNQDNPTQRKVNFFQSSQQVVHKYPQKTESPPPRTIVLTQYVQGHEKLKDEQINSLRSKVEEQVLQIQYLRNQKQILQSNLELQFSPKKGGYQNIKIAIQPHRTITPQKYGVTAPIINQQIYRTKILQLAQILNANQVKINFLQRKYVSVCDNLLMKFNQSLFKSQDVLIKIFSQKYSHFSEQLKVKLQIVDKKMNQISGLDTKIDIFSNTFRSISQNLRFTKLKQENIQLLIDNKYKKTDQYWNFQQTSKILENQSDISSIRRYEDNQIQQKQRQSLYRLSKNINKKDGLTGYQNQGKEQLDSLLDDKYSHLVYKRRKQTPNEGQKIERHFKKGKSPPRKQVITQQLSGRNGNHFNGKRTNHSIQQFSPFQANQMLKGQRPVKFNSNQFQKYQTFNAKNSSKRHHQFSFHEANGNGSRNGNNLSFDDTSSNNYDFSQNSFQIELQFKQKPRNQTPKQISFNSQNMFKKQGSKTSTQKDQISDTLQEQQQRLVNILKNKNHQFPIDCWIDELGCLRKKNQTYIFDEQGSVIMTTNAAFKKLKERKVFL